MCFEPAVERLTSSCATMGASVEIIRALGFAILAFTPCNRHRVSAAAYLPSRHNSVARATLRAAQPSTPGPEGGRQPAAPAVTPGCELVASSSRNVLEGAGARGSTAGRLTGRRPMGACLRGEDAVGGAAHASRATVEAVRVDHRRRDVAVAEGLLNGTDVVPVREPDAWRRNEGPRGRAEDSSDR